MKLAKLYVGWLVVCTIQLLAPASADAHDFNLRRDAVTVFNNSLATQIPVQASFDGIHWSQAVYINANQELNYITYTNKQPNPENKIYLRYGEKTTGNWSIAYTVHGGELIWISFKSLTSDEMTIEVKRRI